MKILSQLILMCGALILIFGCSGASRDSNNPSNPLKPIGDQTTDGNFSPTVIAMNMDGQWKSSCTDTRQGKKAIIQMYIKGDVLQYTQSWYTDDECKFIDTDFLKTETMNYVKLVTIGSVDSANVMQFDYSYNKNGGNVTERWWFKAQMESGVLSITQLNFDKSYVLKDSQWIDMDAPVWGGGSEPIPTGYPSSGPYLLQGKYASKDFPNKSTYNIVIQHVSGNKLVGLTLKFLDSDGKLKKVGKFTCVDNICSWNFNKITILDRLSYTLSIQEKADEQPSATTMRIKEATPGVPEIILQAGIYSHLGSYDRVVTPLFSDDKTKLVGLDVVIRKGSVKTIYEHYSCEGMFCKIDSLTGEQILILSTTSYIEYGFVVDFSVPVSENLYELK